MSLKRIGRTNHAKQLKKSHNSASRSRKSKNAIRISLGIQQSSHPATPHNFAILEMASDQLCIVKVNGLILEYLVLNNPHLPPLLNWEG
jgi:hypothetical protein